MASIARAAMAVAVLTLAGCGSRPVSAPLADGSDTAVSAAIEQITTFPTHLDPRLWDGADLKPEVRQRSMEIVDRVVRTAGIPA